MNTIPIWRQFLIHLRASLTSPPVIAVSILLGIYGFVWFMPNLIQRFENLGTNTVTEIVYETVQVEISDSVAVRQAFSKECTLLGGYVSEIAAVTFCIDAVPIPGILWAKPVDNDARTKATQDCLLAGGRILDLSPTSNDMGCYTYTIFEELGARHDYRIGN